MKVFSPYRICPIGAHIDHQYGNVCGSAINLGITLEYEPTTTDLINISSDKYTDRCVFSISKVERCEGKWYNYLIGAVEVLKKSYDLKIGITGKIKSDLSSGGISSSTSLTIAFIVALCRMNSIKLNKCDLIELSYQVEHEYLGLNVGKLDQYCEVMSDYNSLIFLDTATLYYQNISNYDFDLKYEFILIFSGIQRNNLSSKYNERVQECKSALGKIRNSNTYIGGLRGVPEYAYNDNKNKLLPNEIKRCNHFYSENERVKLGLKAWRNNDIESFGMLMNESCESSLHNYESGSINLNTLFQISKGISGILGFRFLGAGFNGYSVALVKKENIKDISNEIITNYSKVYPDLADKVKIYPVRLTGGIEL